MLHYHIFRLCAGFSKEYTSMLFVKWDCQLIYEMCEVEHPNLSQTNFTRSFYKSKIIQNMKYNYEELHLFSIQLGTDIFIWRVQYLIKFLRYLKERQVSKEAQTKFITFYIQFE